MTNVLNGTVAAGEKGTNQGTVVRLDVFSPHGQPPVLFQQTVIATGFPEVPELERSRSPGRPAMRSVRTTRSALCRGTINNRIGAIPFASFRHTPGR